MFEVTMIGNLTNEVTSRTVKTVRGEMTVANFSVAANEGNGENKRTMYFNVSAWNKIGDTVSQYLHKGSKIYLVGEPRINLYQGKDGLAHASFDVTARQIQFLDPAPKQGSGNGISAPIAPAKTQSQPAVTEPTPEQDAAVFQQVDNNDLPF